MTAKKTTAEKPKAEDTAKKTTAEAAVYGYVKGDKDPTTYDVTDTLYGHVNGPRHREWLSVNG